MQINVAVTDANNIVCQVVPPQTEVITIDRGVAGNGIVSIVPVTISTFQYLRITYTNGTVQDVGPLTSTAYTATSPITIVGNTISLATVPIASGGTDATTAAGAIQNLLPSYTGNANKRLGLNSGGTGLEWVADGGGTVTSIAASGGSTGLTFSGSPITSSGTLTLGGTLAVASGGTGATTAADARTNLSAAYNAITISAGTGLTGGGDLTANRTLSIDSSVVTLTGTQTLTNKTLTSPRINEILDTNGNEILGLSPTASATDFVTIKNGIGVGVPLHIYADGSSASIGLHIQPKGSGLVTISDGTDFNKGIRFRSSGSAASAVTLLDAVSTAGRVVTLPDATTTLVGRDTTDTLTNKTIAFASNTFTGALSIANGGTGQTTANAALNALLPTQTGNASKYLQTDGTNATWDAISLSTADITGILPTANGGTGLSSFTANGVVYASSTSALATGSALSFDASTLKLAANNTSYRGQLTIEGGASDFAQITFYRGSTTNTDQVGYLHSSNSGSTGIALGARNGAILRFEVGDTERARISTSGNFGIGVNPTNAKLEVVASSGEVFRADASGGAFRIVADQTNVSLNGGSNVINSVNGSEVGRFTSTGLGIGTSSPTDKLTLNSSGSGTGFKITGYQPENFINLNNTLSTGNRTFRLLSGITSVGYDGFSIFDTVANATRLVINNSGNLGIATTSPSYKLDVNGDARINNLLWFTPSSGGMALGANGTNFEIYNGAGTETRLTLNNSGNLGIGTSSPSEKLAIAGNVTADIYKLRSNQSAPSSTDAFIYRPADNTIGFGTASAEKMRLDVNGYLGLGTSSPQARIDFGGSTDQSFYIYNASSDRYGMDMKQYDSQGYGTNIFAGNGGYIKLRTASGSSTPETRLTITPTGAVGIGTTAPLSGGLTLGTTASGKNVNLYSSSYANNGVINFYGPDSNLKLQLGATGATSAYLYADTGCSLEFYAGASLRATLTSTGEFLVGTTTLASGFSTYAQIEASGTTGGVLINSGASQIGRLIFTNGNTSGNEGLIRYDGSNNSMQFWANAGERARITSDGNLLVGLTSNPANTNGQISVKGDVGVSIAFAGNDRFTDGSRSIAYYGLTRGGTSSFYSGQFDVNLAAYGGLGFYTEGSLRARIDTSGNFLVGSTTSAGRFYSYTPSNQWAMYAENGLASGSTAGILALVSAQNSSNNSYKAIVYYNSGAGQDRFSVSDTGAIATAGSIALGTNGLPPTTGIGVQFPATQVASSDANTLDDYEEGSWTPSTPTTNLSISASNSYYTKIGRQVTCYCYITITNSSGSNINSFQLNGLPFNSTGYGFVAQYYNPNGGGGTAGDKYIEASNSFAVINNVVLIPGGNPSMYYFSYFA
jgi:trimeric autotransporter adhesin